MLKLLLAVDGSDCSGRAVDHFIDRMDWFKGGIEIHLLNVQHPIPYGNRVSSVVGHEKLQEYHQEEGLAALKPARTKLDKAGIKYHYHIVVGEPAEMIAQYAKEKGCDQIVMGTRGLGTVQGLLLGSVATKVIHLANVPVMLVK
jgi:nucleotide-binding universal stress UspA family protein